MAFSSYRLDFGTEAVSQDVHLAAIMQAVLRHYDANAFTSGRITAGCTVPAVIEHEGRIISVLAKFGTIDPEHDRFAITANADYAINHITSKYELFRQPILLPATSFELSEDLGDKRKHAFTLAEPTPVFYLAGLYQKKDDEYSFALLARPASVDTYKVTNKMPVVVLANDVRAFLTDWNICTEIIKSDPPRLKPSFR